MKKATLSIALFSLVVLTSFTTIQDTGDDDTGGNGGTTTTTSNRDAGGDNNSQNVGGNKKHDFMQPVMPVTSQYPNQEIPSFKKLDF